MKYLIVLIAINHIPALDLGLNVESSSTLPFRSKSVMFDEKVASMSSTSFSGVDKSRFLVNSKLSCLVSPIDARDTLLSLLDLFARKIKGKKY